MQGVAAANIRETTVDYALKDFADVIVAIKRFYTDGKACILNTIQGDANVAFYKEVANQGLSSIGCSVLAFSISEDELR